MPELSTALLTESRLDAAARHAGDLWLPDHPYFDAAEAHFDLLWHVIEPFLQGANFDCVLDLATGRGRNARKLLPLAQRLILVDIRPENTPSAASASPTTRASASSPIPATTCGRCRMRR